MPHHRPEPLRRVGKLRMLAGAITALLGVSLLQCSTTSRTSSVGTVDYNIHVRPILSDKCFACHGPDAGKRKAGLRLDTPEGAFAALTESPGRFALVAGDLAKSELWHRISSEDPSALMPPPESNLKLAKAEIEILKQWIEQGAEYKPHWAFIPPMSPAIPAVKDEAWPKEQLDYFVLARMKAEGLSPNPSADAYRLLKRLSFDLTGLPPSLEMQERFLADESEDAYERMVDELMESPHYGERMAVPWLDAARYADSHGYQDDGLRTMWPWRDWVIHAFNQNYPYDQFITWQLAGDLLSDANKEQLLATGFNRNHKITQEGGVIDEEYRIEYVTDRTNTFGKALLGLTLECAKCHDHKYDPISQKAYYQTFAFFDQVPEKGIFGTIDANFADPPNMEITQEDVEGILSFVNKQDSLPLRVMVMQDSLGLRSTHILDRGLYDAKTDTVFPATPEAIMPFDTSKFASNRLGLAEWMFSPENPLTSRVFVNRIWAQFFGTGLVPSVGDFGMQGELPSHPALLDWLAVDFRENGWDVKRLVKQIVMSATYRQSAVISDKALAIDPENRFLSYAPRNRLDAEFVRDHVLASSGLLHAEIGGPSVKPYQPDGLWKAATSGRGLLQEYFQDQGTSLYRRGIYTFIKRTVPPPKMLMFDGSNRDQCEVERLRTNTPLQALAMLNDPLLLEASRVLAQQLATANPSAKDRIQVAFQRILARPPSTQELLVLEDYFEEEKTALNQDQATAVELLNVGEYPQADMDNPIECAALMQVILTLYNMEETLMKT